MNEITTLPASVRQRLEQAQNLASQDRMSEAMSMAREAGRVLASSHPEACAALLAVQHGYRGISHTIVEKRTEITQKDHVVLGVRVGRDIETRTEMKTIHKDLEFF